MTPDDLEPAGQAAGEVVHALDEAVCGLARGAKPAARQDARAELLRTATRGEKLVVTEVLWQDAKLTHAQLELHADTAAGGKWRARMSRSEGGAWQVAAFDAQ